VEFGHVFGKVIGRSASLIGTYPIVLFLVGMRFGRDLFPRIGVIGGFDIFLGRMFSILTRPIKLAKAGGLAQ
jgi:hypothetical protein